MKTVLKRGAVAGRPSKAKYGNRKTVVDGITFDSLAEARRYADLKLMERGGAICDLVLQPKYPCVVNGVKVCTYIADFEYRAGPAPVTEDVKGIQTPIFRLKKKLVEALYPGTTITVVKS